MPLIRPLSELRNRFTEISRLCHEEGEPVFLTKNGRDNLVVMSHAFYDQIFKQFELYQKLDEAEKLDAQGEKGITHNQVHFFLSRNRNVI